MSLQTDLICIESYFFYIRSMKKNSFHSHQFKAGSRTYFFDVKETEQAKRYLSITESKRSKTDDIFERHHILIFEEDIEDFANSVNNALLHFYASDPTNPAQAHAGQPWTAEDDNRLEELFCKGKNTNELATIFKRTTGAIRSRIKHLELREKYG